MSDTEWSAPRTDAGRDALHAVDMIGEAYNVNVGYKQWQKRILAIEEQARAEGRQEAVDRLRAVLPDTMELHSDYHGAGERFYRADDVDFALDAILDRVAGLDASESGQPPEDQR